MEVVGDKKSLINDLSKKFKLNLDHTQQQKTNKTSIINKISLTPWLNDYYSEVSKMIENYPESDRTVEKLSLDILLRILHLHRETREHIEKTLFTEYMNKRLECVKDKYLYIQTYTFNETEQVITEKAKTFLFYKLKLKKGVFVCEDLPQYLPKEILTSLPFKTYKLYELPDFTKEQMIAIITEFVNNVFQGFTSPVEIQTSEDYYHYGEVNYRYCDDLLFSKYGIRSKMFGQLLDFHDLRGDYEVFAALEQMKSLGIEF